MRSTLNDDDNDPALVSKKFWSHVKSVSNCSRIPESVSYNGSFRNNTQGQTELFNIFFSDQFSDPSNYDIPINFRNDPGHDFCISHTDVRNLLKNLNSNKAQGPDGIHGMILKKCAISIAYPLSLIYNTSYNTGLIPDEWKLAYVVPVFKKGSKSLVENYRPISLTCLTMKIFEKLVRNRLMSLCKHKLNPSQHGFLPAKSCTTQMIPFIDNLAITLNDISPTDVIYFDFAKAFDSVNHDIILSKLKSKFHIDGILLKFLVNYLKDRKQLVVIGGSKSSVLPVLSGVPQGSILSPLLFVLFIDDLPDNISQGTNITLYADDTKIWRKITCHRDELILQHDINTLNTWSKKNKMNFHPKKCKVLTVTSSHNLSYRLPCDRFVYCLDNECLDYVDSEKDLGVYVTSKLNWREHVKYLCSKANRMLGLIQRSCHFVKDTTQKRILYLALSSSQFNHCSPVWRPNTVALFNKIERVQVRAIKWILSEQGTTYSSIIYFKKCRDLDLLPLKLRLDLFSILLFHKIIHKTVAIDLPAYIRLAPETSLRSSHKDALTYESLIKPRITKLSLNRNVKYKNTRNKVKTNPKVTIRKAKCCKKRKKKGSTFFKKRINSKEKIYKNKEVNDHDVYTENKVFSGSFFYKTHLQWNKLPYEIKSIENYEHFKIKLEEYLWESILGEDDSICVESDIEVPGD